LYLKLVIFQSCFFVTLYVAIISLKCLRPYQAPPPSDSVSIVFCKKGLFINVQIDSSLTGIGERPMVVHYSPEPPTQSLSPCPRAKFHQFFLLLIWSWSFMWGYPSTPYHIIIVQLNHKIGRLLWTIYIYSKVWISFRPSNTCTNFL
jgi:hypothetical protein